MFYLKRVFVFLFLFLVFFSGCDDSSSRKHDSDVLLDEDSADTDVYVDEENNDSEGVDSDLDTSLFPDESFLSPSKGLTLKMKGVISSQSVQNGSIDVLDVIYTDENGNNLYLNDKASANIAAQSGSVVVTFSEAVMTDNRSHFIYFSFPKSYLDSDDIGKIAERTDVDPVVYQYEYKEGGKIVIQCPVAVKDNSKSLLSFVDSEDQTFIAGDTMYAMMNVPLIKGKTALREFYGENSYDNMCYCYDYIEEDGSYKPRSCETGDLYLKPEKPYALFPKDRSLNSALQGTVELAFSGGEDPQGFDVTYSIYAGKDPLNLNAVAENVTSNKLSFPVEAGMNYFWKIKAENIKGLYSESEIYSFTTKDSSEYADLLILVNKDKETALSDVLNEYVQQLQNEGYKAELKYLIFDEEMPLTVEDLKNIIKTYYQEKFIRGTLLLGNFPAAWYEMDMTVTSSTSEPYQMYETFPTDIYLSDFTAEWFDERDKDNNSVANGIYDRHTALNTKVFVARILGESDKIANYFNKVKKYKTEGHLISPSLFLFIDEDWQSGAGSTWWLENVYEKTTEYATPETTTQDKYLDFMTGSGAEFIYQWIHSDPGMLYFNTNYGGDYLTRETIENSGVKGSFYNLFDCSAVRFTEENLGDMYLKTEYGLAVIGSSKTGGMYNPKIFHTDLSNSLPWGIAFRDWYNEEGVKDDSWFLGFNIMGDPLIKLNSENSTVYKRSVSTKEFNVWEISELKKKMITQQKLRNNGGFDIYKKQNPSFFKILP